MTPDTSRASAPPAFVPPIATADPAGDPSLATLRAVTRTLSTAEDLETVLQSIVRALVERADAFMARVFVPMHDRDCAVCRAAGRLSDAPALHILASAGDVAGAPMFFHRIPLDSMLPPAVIMRTRESALLPDWRQDSRMSQDPNIVKLWGEQGIVSAAGYPLVFQGEFLGVIGYVSRRRIEPQEFEVLGVFADQAAMAIKNAQLFQELARHRERLQVENAYLQDEIRADHGFDHIVGESAALRAVLRKVRQVSHVETTVLLTGETGTGKELVARAIHENSPRHERALVKVNCGAIPQGLVESELCFELADKGTLFMDEVGELPLDTQVKLLRVLQEQEFERVGSAQLLKVNVRLIAATNRDLEREVKEGRFRADLFYRLNVFPIRIPPLRERPEDIPLLVTHFLAHFQRKLAKPLRAVTPASLEQLRRYAWPGNIRELQNVLERACVLARGPEVELADPLRPAPSRSAVTAAEGPIPTLDDGERAHIRRALAAANGKIHGPQGAAALLGINPSTLRSRMQKLGVGKER
jgi:formate hydrogenlyase transcriptional activator